MTLINSLKARQAAKKSEGGFSLIDVVVTVAIIVALSVGGFIAYTGLVQNAKDSATAAAADQVYTAALVATNDGGIGTLTEIEDDYNDSSDAIKVKITPDNPATADVNELSVTATHDNGGKSATRGAPAPVVPSP